MESMQGAIDATTQNLPTPSPTGAIIVGLLVGFFTIALDAYLLNFLGKVKERCLALPTTPRIIAEIILWFQLVGSVLACIVGLYALFACSGKNATSEFCSKMAMR